jgi:hypothetical protein
MRCIGVPQPQVVFSGSRRISRRRVGRQLLALGYLPLASRLGQGLHALDLGGHRRRVAVQGLFQQALLLSVVGLAVLLTSGRELQPLEDRVLVRELVDDRLLERHLGTRDTQCPAQLLRIQRVEVFGDHGL